MTHKELTIIKALLSRVKLENPKQDAHIKECIALVDRDMARLEKRSREEREYRYKDIQDSW